MRRFWRGIAGVELEDELPENDHQSLFRPGAKLHLPLPDNVENLNTRQYLEGLQRKIFDNIDRCALAGPPLSVLFSADLCPGECLRHSVITFGCDQLVCGESITRYAVEEPHEVWCHFMRGGMWETMQRQPFGQL